MSKVGHKAMMAADRPEVAAVKERLKAAEKLRAEGVVLGRVNNVFCLDSWAAHIDELPGFRDGDDPQR